MDFQCEHCKFPFKKNISDSTPKVLNCGHTFCKKCLHRQQHQTRNIYRVSCYECKKVTSTIDNNGLEDLRTNKQLFVLSHEVSMCYSCNNTYSEENTPHIIQCGHTVCKLCTEKKARCHCEISSRARKFNKPINHHVLNYCLQNEATHPQGPACGGCQKLFTSYQVRQPQRLDCGCTICKICLHVAYEKAGNGVVWSVSCPFANEKGCKKTVVHNKQKLFNNVDGKVLRDLKQQARRYSEPNPSEPMDMAFHNDTRLVPSAPSEDLVFDQYQPCSPPTSAPPAYDFQFKHPFLTSAPIPVPFIQERPIPVPEYSPGTVEYHLQEKHWNVTRFSEDEQCYQFFISKQTGMMPLTRH